VKNVDPGKKNV
jgi:dynein heavy chain